MRDDDARRLQQLERDITALFEATGYRVEESVGSEPGTVCHIAEGGQGLSRLRTYWEVWLDVPPPSDRLLTELDDVRQFLKADRALGIVVRGSLPPEDARPLWRAHVSQAISLRRLFLEFTGIADEMRSLVNLDENAPAHPRQFLPRQATTAEGETVDAVEYVERWIREGQGQELDLVGREGVGKRTLLRHLAYRSARDWVQTPATATPFVQVMKYLRHPPKLPDKAKKHLIDPSWATFDGKLARTLPAHCRKVSTKRLAFWHLLPPLAREQLSLHRQQLPPPAGELLQISPPSVDEFQQWYRKRTSASRYEMLRDAVDQSKEFLLFAYEPRHLSRLLPAIRNQDDTTGELPLTWLAKVVASFMRSVVAELRHRPSSTDIPYYADMESPMDLIETGAFEQFVLGTASHSLGELFKAYDPEDLDDDEQGFPVGSWLEAIASDHEEKVKTARFTNPLIRDYFIASKIATDVRSGRIEILTRYQFPERYVLLFLAVLAPDVAALATADRSEAIRAQISAEVEQQVQLALSHHLLRAVGAVRSNLKRIRKRLRSPGSEPDAPEWRRVDQELDFIKRLVDQTRAWHEVPETEKQSLQLAEVTRELITPLSDQYKDVTCEFDIAEELTVTVSQAQLREAIHCLLENAFHAVSMPDSPDQPHIAITARLLGEGRTIRLDIIDNGPGIRPEDRERIFEPRVTTKKGGEGLPLGTGMGLPIARRYAEAMGGRVGLDPDLDNTCFYLELVASRRAE